MGTQPGMMGGPVPGPFVPGTTVLNTPGNQRGSMVAPAGDLHVQVQGARGLPDADGLPGAGKSDAYAVVEIKGKRQSRFKTGVIHNTKDPMWNAESDVPGFEAGDSVVVTVYDKDPLKGDDVLGTVTLPYEQFAGGLIGDVKLDTGDAGKDSYVTLAIQPPQGGPAAPYPSGVMDGGQMLSYSGAVAGPGGVHFNQQGVMMPGAMQPSGRGSFGVPGTGMMQHAGSYGHPYQTRGSLDHMGQPIQEPIAGMAPAAQMGTQLMQGGNYGSGAQRLPSGALAAPGTRGDSLAIPMGTIQGGPLKSGGLGVPRGTFVGGSPVTEPVAGFPMGAPVGTFVGGPPGTQMMAPSGTYYTGGGMPTGMAGPMPTGAYSPSAMRGGILKAGSITDDVFNMVDRNQDGVISRSEFRGALKGNIISATPTARQLTGR